MEERTYAIFGIIGPLILYFSIGISIIFSPWFNWEVNVLSDFGDSINSNVAPIFNSGLLLAGFFLMIYSATVFKKHSKYSSVFLLISSFLVQLLATFNEAYGSLHYVVAIPHFVMLSLTSIVYSVEKKSILAVTTVIIVLLSWLLYGLQIFNIGIAVPETISKIVILWIIYSAIKIYKKI